MLRLMLLLEDGERDKDFDTAGLVSATEGRSLGKRGFLGLASWSNRDIEYVLPGDLVNGLFINDDDSRLGIVGIRSVLRRPMYPLAQPAGGIPSSDPVPTNAYQYFK